MDQPRLTPQQRRKHQAGKARLRAKLRKKRERKERKVSLAHIEAAWAKAYWIHGH